MASATLILLTIFDTDRFHDVHGPLLLFTFLGIAISGLATAVIYWEATAGYVKSEKGRAVRKWLVDAGFSQEIAKLMDASQARDQFHNNHSGSGNNHSIYRVFVQLCLCRSRDLRVDFGLYGCSLHLDLRWLGVVSHALQFLCIYVWVRVGQGRLIRLI